MANLLGLGEVEIEYTDDSDSAAEPLLLVHGGLFSDWFIPVEAADRLRGRRVIRVRRAGYVRAEDAAVPLSIAERAAHCASVLDALGIERAHVCGHSSGAVIALQLALDRPDLVRSLILLEPAPGGDLVAPSALPVIEGPMAESMARFTAGDAAAGFDLFMRATCAEDYQEVIEAALGAGATAQAVRESPAFLAEAQAFAGWTFGAAEAERLTMPVLAVAGGSTAEDCPLPPDSVDRLAGLVAHCETAVLDGANHLMPLAAPDGVSDLIASFAERHPIAVVASSGH
jgi:pimeloyl-ACP methyl ester carboxylesterase